MADVSDAAHSFLRCGRKSCVCCSACRFSPIVVSSGFSHYRKGTVRILHVLGALLIVLWLILWLALKVTFAAIHALVVVGVILIVIAFIAGRSAGSKS